MMLKQQKYIKYIAFLVLMLMVIYFLGTDDQKTGQVRLDLTGGKSLTLNVEIADNEYTREQGLMDRTSLAVDHGMLFVFKRPVEINIWMKNTLIALDIIFVDSDGKIVNIHKNAKPMSLDLIPSKSPITKILEINGGIADKENIQIGDRLELVKINRN